MVREFDTETIRLINIFENLTKANVVDCLLDKENNIAYFVVEENQAGIAIGKNGFKIKQLEKLISKKIKVFEYSTDLEKFVKNLIPKVLEFKLVEEDKKRTVIVRVDKTERPVIIGREGRNLKIYKKLLLRNHKVNELIIR
ncbi:MAG: NusA-like transcription termination signal-binding factor [Candidatus Aenigmarchaeota archaeon]|nr:NusA-like transcription termination signal-binding factor [Candidatus Aenigmarchaeota archaeon]